MTAAPRLLVISPSCHEPVNRAVFRELAARGTPVHLVVPERHFVGGKWQDTVRRPGEGYGLTHLPLVGTHMRLQRLLGLGAVVRDFAPTHVYVDADPGSVLTLQAAWIARRAKIATITAENLPPESLAAFGAALRARNPRAMLNVGMKSLFRRLARMRVDRVFTLSDDGTRVVQDMGFAATKIPLGYDPALFFVQPEDKRTDTRADLGLTRPTVAYFGRQVPEKGIHILLDALAQLTDLDWQLLLDSFASQSAYAQALSEQIDRLALRERVVFFHSSHEDMPDFMNAADLVTLPSISTPKWKEQYGRVIQEVQACGRIMVASASGAIPEVMDGQGHLVPEGDADALAAKLRDLLNAGTFGDPAAAASALRLRSIGRQAEILDTYLHEAA